MCEARIFGARDLKGAVWVQSIIEDPLMRHSAILVFANKQDLVRPLAHAPPASWVPARWHRLRTFAEKMTKSEEQ